MQGFLALSIAIMVRFSTGNMFDAQVDAIVNTVNLVGVMGKGVALQFKERFKNNYEIYKQACKDRTIGIGNSLVVKEMWQGKDVYVINFPTKVHWRNLSEYWYIERGLDNLIDIINNYAIKSIAIPPLGAGNGGLEWPKVKDLIVSKLSPLDCEVWVFEPGHQAASIDKKVKLTPARAMLVYMLDRLQQEGNDATAFSAVKSVYFLQKFGAEKIFKMKFERYIYGPYCDQVRHVLHAIDGGYIRGFADMSKRPFEPFDIIPEKMDEVKNMVENDILFNDIVTRTCQFLEGFWDDYSLELISSVDYLIAEKPDSSVEDVYESLGSWTERKKILFADKDKVLEAYNHIKKRAVAY